MQVELDTVRSVIRIVVHHASSGTSRTILTGRYQAPAAETTWTLVQVSPWYE
jgi:hypothetical protein